MTTDEKIAAIRERVPNYRVERKDLPVMNREGAKATGPAICSWCHIGEDHYELTQAIGPEGEEVARAMVVAVAYRQFAARAA